MISLFVLEVLSRSAFIVRSLLFKFYSKALLLGLLCSLCSLLGFFAGYLSIVLFVPWSYVITPDFIEPVCLLADDEDDERVDDAAD